LLNNPGEMVDIIDMVPSQEVGVLEQQFSNQLRVEDNISMTYE